MFRPHPARRALLVLLAAVLVLACSGSSDSDESADATSAPTAGEGSTDGSGSDGDTSADTGDNGDAGQESNGELHLALVDIQTLDPLGASPASVSHVLLADLLYDTLTELDAAGRARPGLATATANADRTVWRFRLDDDAAFDDGSAIGADDVVYSLDRARSQGADSLTSLQLEDVVAVTARDESTVDIELSEPSAVLPELLSSPHYGIIDRDRTEAARSGENVVPLTSGDHGLVVESADRLRLDRHRGTGPDVVAHLFGDSAGAFEAFDAGDVDWSPVPVDRIGEAVRSVGTDGLVPFHGTVQLGVNPKAGKLQSRGLRRAIALAIDRHTLVEAVFGPAAQPLLGLVPAGVPGAASECRTPCGPDRKEARRLAGDAFGKGQERPLQLLVDRSETQRSIAGVVQDQLDAADIDVEITRVEPTAFDTLLSAGRQELFLFGTLGVSRTAAVHLDRFHSESPDNLVGYRNDLVDAAINEALDEPVDSVRADRWREIEGAVLADAPVVPLVQLRTVAAISPRVEGLHVRVDGSIDLSEVTFDRDAEG